MQISEWSLATGDFCGGRTICPWHHADARPAYCALGGGSQDNAAVVICGGEKAFLRRSRDQNFLSLQVVISAGRRGLASLHLPKLFNRRSGRSTCCKIDQCTAASGPIVAHNHGQGFEIGDHAGTSRDRAAKGGAQEPRARRVPKVGEAGEFVHSDH